MSNKVILPPQPLSRTPETYQIYNSRTGFVVNDKPIPDRKIAERQALNMNIRANINDLFVVRVKPVCK